MCCEAYKNIAESDVDKLKVTENNNIHQKEKKNCAEKKRKMTFLKKITLFAVLITPRGEIS